MIKKILKILFKYTPFVSIRIVLLKLAGYKIGKNVYLPSDLVISDLKNRKNNLHIGNRVSIGPNVTLITDSGPNNSILINQFPTISGEIIICDDAWIGAGSIILPNVKVGKCSIVAAGSVCNKDIPEYTIVGGVPAKIIKKINGL